MPTVHDAKLLFELLMNCDVKVESVPDKNRLYWLSDKGWVVSDGTKLQDFPKLSDAIVEFTKLIYT